MNSTTPTIQLLTVDDLAARWQMKDHAPIWKLVDEGKLPFRYLGRGVPEKGGRKRRGNYRFHPAEVEAYERGSRLVFGDAEPTRKTAKIPGLKGEPLLRTGMKRTKGPKGQTPSGV